MAAKNEKIGLVYFATKYFQYQNPSKIDLNINVTRNGPSGFIFIRKGTKKRVFVTSAQKCHL
jgi:hypothetical protein